MVTSTYLQLGVVSVPSKRLLLTGLVLIVVAALDWLVLPRVGLTISTGHLIALSAGALAAILGYIKGPEVGDHARAMERLKIIQEFLSKNGYAVGFMLFSVLMFAIMAALVAWALYLMIPPTVG